MAENKDLTDMLATLHDATAALARYANHDSQCDWKWSLTNPRKPCSCGLDEAMYSVSNVQDDLERTASSL